MVGDGLDIEIPETPAVRALLAAQTYCQLRLQAAQARGAPDEVGPLHAAKRVAWKTWRQAMDDLQGEGEAGGRVLTDG